MLLCSVLAFPNASRIGFVSSTLVSIDVSSGDDDVFFFGDDNSPVAEPPPTSPATYFITNLVVSVFPAPDSPVMIMLWLSPFTCICLNALSAVKKMCGR